MPVPPNEEIWVDVNGCPTERRMVGDTEVIVHYDDIPDKDITTVRGIPCTTALRAVIDVAANLEPDQLVRIVHDCLGRRLFTVREARARIAEPDMQGRLGADLLRRALAQ